MKALSLWQPWASLMAAGYKRIETRSWVPYKLREGQLVAIHAAKRWTAEERDICQEAPFRRYLTLAQARGLWDFDKPPLGCVIAVARFQRALPTMDGYFDYSHVSNDEYAFGNYQPGRYGWVFSEVRPIQPIPARGMQGLFDWTQPAELPYVEARNGVSLLPLWRVNA